MTEENIMTDPIFAAALEEMKGQLIIALVSRLGGEVKIPAAEIDSTGDRNLIMGIKDSIFTFKVEKKIKRFQ